MRCVFEEIKEREICFAEKNDKQVTMKNCKA